MKFLFAGDFASRNNFSGRVLPTLIINSFKATQNKFTQIVCSLLAKNNFLTKNSILCDHLKNYLKIDINLTVHITGDLICKIRKGPQ